MLILELRCQNLVGCDNAMALEIGIQNSGLITSHKPGARILTAVAKANSGGQREGEEWQTNPIELTCFLSTTYRKEGRNKPKGDMSNGVSDLEGNQASFLQNMNDIEPGLPLRI